MIIYKLRFNFLNHLLFLEKNMKKNILAVLSHNPIVILFVAFIFLIVLYYIASPYQNCMRFGDINTLECLKVTSW